MEQNIPRAEYPRPQLKRDDWRCLNGLWTYTFDCGRSGLARGLNRSRGFEDDILVPFCPESRLSGVGYTDFIPAIWYQRMIQIPEAWSHEHILLHIGASDYETEVYIDGAFIGRHWGGSSSFCLDLARHVKPGGEHSLVIHVQDDVRSGAQPSGKQSIEYGSAGCFYTRTTGIWQSVWMEPVAQFGVKQLSLIPDISTGALIVTALFWEAPIDTVIEVELLDSGRTMGRAKNVAANGVPIRVDFHEKPQLWCPSNPFLYDLEVRLRDPQDREIDAVQSYIGVRSFCAKAGTFSLNNEPLYLRFVLDQGFYPEGIWTAPTDEALRSDIKLAMECGFNGARLHQKIFEERFHYWADRLGFLTFGESPSWGLNMKSEAGARNYLCEWREIVERDRNHPSLVAWTTLNETWDISDSRQHRRLHEDAYNLTRSLDPTRCVSNASGGSQVVTDIYSVHIYEQEPRELRAKLTPSASGAVFQTLSDNEVPHDGEPYFIGEFGGIKWNLTNDTPVPENAWGYGESPRSESEFFKRLEGLIDVLFSFPHISGYCYTQLTDVEQEQNGLFEYDRSGKFSIERLRSVFSRIPKQFGEPLQTKPRRS